MSIHVSLLNTILTESTTESNFFWVVMLSGYTYLLLKVFGVFSRYIWLGHSRVVDRRTLNQLIIYFKIDRSLTAKFA